MHKVIHPAPEKTINIIDQVLNLNELQYHVLSITLARKVRLLFTKYNMDCLSKQARNNA